MSGSAPSNVPKFASFRPKPLPLNSDESQTNAAGIDDHRKHHSRNLGERPKGGARHHHQSRRARSRSRENIQPVVALPKSVTEGHEQPEFFVIDKKGDLNNVVYGTIHKYSIPTFHRYGSGRVLGASPDLRLNRDRKDEKTLILVNPNTGPRVREKYVFSRIERQKPRLLKIRLDTLSEEPKSHDTDFIPLRGIKENQRKRKEVSDERSTESDDDKRDYRSIYYKAQDNEAPLDEDLRYATESESPGSENGQATRVSSSVRAKNILLSRRVEQSPHDIDGWLALIEYQDEVIQGGDDHRQITSAEIKSTAEIKIHMYEKALKNARSLEDREKLLIGLMAEGSKVWDMKAQASHWEEISRTNINSVTLYLKYLDFKQTTFSTFRFEEVRSVYLERIKLLLEAVAVSTSFERAEALYRQLLYIFLRLTFFMHESGYTELAVSSWQSLLEMNFCGPAKTENNVQSINLFRDFWESEVPRIGEHGALGWRRYMETERFSGILNPIVDNPDDLLDNRNLFKSWASAERLRSIGSKIPAKTMDEVVEDDPFRVILFSDIEDFVFLLPPDSESLRTLCIDAFLRFCRLPPLASSLRDDPVEWCKDAFVQGTLLDHDSNWITQKHISSFGHNEEPNGSALPRIPCPNVAISSESLFKNSPDVESYRDPRRGVNQPVSYIWIRNCLTQLTQVWFNELLAEYYLSFEFRNEPETIKKVSKELLKQHSTSLRLYHAYGLIEWSRGNKETAKGVFSAALDMSRSMAKHNCDIGNMTLWRSWIWASLEDGDNTSALKYLICVPDGLPNLAIEFSNALLLKATQYFTLNRDFLISSNAVGHSTIHCECLALLIYLSGGKTSEKENSGSQGDIDAALAVFTSFSRVLQERAHIIPHELFLQSAARLLLHHARAGPFRPALIREHLNNFLKIFPCNTFFLELYSWNESRLRIDRRVRNILFTTILTPQNDTLSSRLFAIHYEVHNGTIHSAKSAFEHALSSPNSKYSANLWRLYILYCLQTTEFRAHTKDIWLRGLKACPWAKELYIFGFEKLSDMITFGELKSTWRVMGEKELRVHVDLEDKFDELSELEVAGPSHRRVVRQ